MARSKIWPTGGSRRRARIPRGGTAQRQDFAPHSGLSDHVRRPSGSACLKKARRVQRGKALSSLLGFGAKSQASTAIEKPKCSRSCQQPQGAAGTGTNFYSGNSPLNPRVGSLPSTFRLSCHRFIRDLSEPLSSSCTCLAASDSGFSSSTNSINLPAM